MPRDASPSPRVVAATGRTLQQVILGVLLPLLLQGGGIGLGVSGSRILLTSMMQHSHFSALATIGRELTGRGHEIYALVRDDFRVPTGTEDFITLVTYPKAHPERDSNIDVIQRVMRSALEGTNHGLLELEILRTVARFIDEGCEEILMESEATIAQLESLNLDLIIADIFPMGKCFHLLACRLGIPTVDAVDMLDPWPLRLPIMASHTPNPCLSLPEDMSFLQRVANAVAYTGMSLFFFSFSGPRRLTLERYSAFCDVESGPGLLSRSLLYLYQADPLLDSAIPLTPNVVPIGGVSARPANPLPEDLQRALDDPAIRDVILMTMGSMFADLGDGFALKVIGAFQSLPALTFVWRFENRNNLTVPPNVILRKWLPQNDLLGHPKVKAFISHCGRNGLFEALYHGVPVVGLPIGGDQPRSAFIIERKGYGISLDSYTFSSNQLAAAITEVVRNDSYASAIYRASEIFKDAPETPRQRAARMIDHVIKFGGSHLRSQAFHLNWFQFWLLDVTAFLVAVLVGVCYVTVRLAKCCCACCRIKGTSKLKAN